MANAQPAKAVVKTVRILEELSREGEMGITQLSDSVGMHKSTVYRFVNTLQELGYVYQDSQNERYGLTLKLVELGSPVLERLELRRVARPVLENLASETQETIHLAVLDEGRLVYVDKIESTRALRVSMMSGVGLSAPTYCTGVGKVLLAYLEPEARDEVLSGESLQRFTENTITDREQMEKELTMIRQNDYGIDNEEHEVGVRCVAAPVRDNRHEVIAAVSISAPSVRLTNSEIPQFRNAIREAADEISNRLGAGQTAAIQAVPRPATTSRE